MLYHLLENLENHNSPGSGLYKHLSFRAEMTLLFSLLISTTYGKRIISFLQRKQIGETIRDLGLSGRNEKADTPIMGGIIIILATLIPALLLAKLNSVYTILLLITTVWIGTIGFIDDYIKTFRKNKEGLRGRLKVLGQVGLGIIVGVTLYFSDAVTIKSEKVGIGCTHTEVVTIANSEIADTANEVVAPEIESTKTAIPFVKNNEFNYADPIAWTGKSYHYYVWLVFIPLVILIVTAVSNGASLTDGTDGLAAGSSAVIVLTLEIFAWVSGNIIFSEYLDIMYIPRVGEMTVSIAALAGALVGFLWYNIYPAQVFMGDTGSLIIDGIITVTAIAVRRELLTPVLCGIFLVENLSVILQVAYSKHTKKKYGEGRRIFLMSPLHHHYQKRGYHESKIVIRFLIVGIFLAVISIVTPKIK